VGGLHVAGGLPETRGGKFGQGAGSCDECLDRCWPFWPRPRRPEPGRVSWRPRRGPMRGERDAKHALRPAPSCRAGEVRCEESLYELVPSHWTWPGSTPRTCGRPDSLRRCPAGCLTESGPRWPFSRGQDSSHGSPAPVTGTGRCPYSLSSPRPRAVIPKREALYCRTAAPVGRAAVKAANGFASSVRGRRW
jgi:hypothetical protein